MPRSPKPAAVYRLKVTLQGLDPPVWRRLQVSAETTLTRLHHILQSVMGWDDYHEHAFLIGGMEYGRRTLVLGNTVVMGERGLQLRYEVPAAPAQFTHLYDFGDGWKHTVEVEEIAQPARGKRYPVCVVGARACPPEDVGGIPGFEDFLQVVGDHEHPRHQELLTWVGGRFDPEAFDLTAVNRKLARLW